MKLPLWNISSEKLHGPAKLFAMIFLNLLELVVLNISFLLCCIPILTIPFATSALIRVLSDFCRDSGSKPIRTYWKNFFQFRRRTFFAGMPLVLLEGLLGWGIMVYLSTQTSSVLFWLACGFNIAAFLLVVLTKFYVFPLLHETNHAVLWVWKTAFCLMMSKIQYTLVAFALIVALWAVCIRNFQSTWIVFVLLLFSLTYFIGTFCATHWVEQYLLQQNQAQEE